MLRDIREAVGLDPDSTSFDTELTMHINTAIGKLNQNGIGEPVFINSDVTSWHELMNPLQLEGNKYFQMVPLFITLSTKILFDPPPPSSVQYYASNIDQLLWRLKLAYEETYVAPVVEDDR